MNSILITFIFIFLAMWTCSNLSIGKDAAGATEVRTVVISESASSGLDLEALPSIVQKAKTAEELEKLLNAEGGVNNLDLDDNGVVDFITVTEFSEGDKHGFSFTSEPAEGEEQEIAVIEIAQENDNASVTVEGNRNVYGSGASYSSSFPLGSFFLMSYLLSPHRFYASPFGYGAYPGYYRPYSSVGYNDYRSQTQNARQSSSAKRAAGTSISSPNANKTANSGIRKKLSSPTSSQKSFQTRNPAKKVGSGGFGRSSKTFGSARNFTSTSRGFGGFGK